MEIGRGAFQGGLQNPPEALPAGEALAATEGCAEPPKADRVNVLVNVDGFELFPSDAVRHPVIDVLPYGGCYVLIQS